MESAPDMDALLDEIEDEPITCLPSVKKKYPDHFQSKLPHIPFPQEEKIVPEPVCISVVPSDPKVEDSDEFINQEQSMTAQNEKEPSTETPNTEVTQSIGPGTLDSNSESLSVENGGDHVKERVKSIIPEDAEFDEVLRYLDECSQMENDDVCNSETQLNGENAGEGTGDQDISPETLVLENVSVECEKAEEKKESIPEPEKVLLREEKENETEEYVIEEESKPADSVSFLVDAACETATSLTNTIITSVETECRVVPPSPSSPSSLASIEGESDEVKHSSEIECLEEVSTEADCMKDQIVPTLEEKEREEENEEVSRSADQTSSEKTEKNEDCSMESAVDSLVEPNLNVEKLASCQEEEETRNTQTLLPKCDEVLDDDETHIGEEKEQMEEKSIYIQTTEDALEEGSDFADVSVAEIAVVDGENATEAEEISSNSMLEVSVLDEEKERNEMVENGLETAIESGFSDREQLSPQSLDGEAEGVSEPVRFESIATVHDLGEETDANRLTESERMLGKQKPYWIPDSDCHVCMLCSTKFSLLMRRHHCRACGRVLCAACCNEKAELDYMKEESKKPSTARICSPCSTMLLRIEEYERDQLNNQSPSTEDTTHSNRSRGVLKTRSDSAADAATGSRFATENVADGAGITERKRSVMFRDGVAPGSSSTGPVEEEKSTTVKPKKKSSRKRNSVVRRIVELKLEDELACALPTSTRSSLLIIDPVGGQMMSSIDIDSVNSRLKEGDPVTIVLKKNLNCVVQRTKSNSSTVWCVSSRGFSSIGLDEIVFVWREKEEKEEVSLPLNVLHRLAEVFVSSCDSDVSAGVRVVSARLPSLHSSHSATFPLTKHIYFFPPTLQDVSFLPSLPDSPFVFACFILDSELPWIMACPNRVLFRLGLLFSWYPTPIVNEPGRDAVYSAETSQTVLKVFTDFRNWSYRMQLVSGATVTLKNDKTVVRIPRSAKKEIGLIVSWNRSMIAWGCDVNCNEADSHLVCDESNGLYSTQVLARGGTRQATGASFVVLDGALKSTSQLQVSVVEDGVAIRMQQTTFNSLLDVLTGTVLEDFHVTDSVSGSQLSIEWVDSSENCGNFPVKSAIDGLYLGNKFQYGLSLERAITSVLQVNSCADYGIRLSHVYNLKEGRLASEEEPRVFSVAELVCRECSALLDPFLLMLINMSIWNISVRVTASEEAVEYDVSPWIGLETEQLKFRESMDQLIPVLYNILHYLPGGFQLEIVLSFVSTKSLPIA